MADQERIDVERHRLAIGNAGEPLALGPLDAEDHIVVAEKHAVRDGGHAEFADAFGGHGCTGASAGRPRIMSAAFSAIISTQALMCAETRSGMAEASTTRSRS